MRPSEPIAMNSEDESREKCSSRPAGLVRYVVITPVRDEGHLIEEMIRSVAEQTLRPSQWIIVDDGSKDDTGPIIDRCAKKYPWITAVHQKDRGFREPGTGVIHAFYYGYGFLSTSDWDFIVKLDGDLMLEPDYFENCLAEFARDPRLGIGGGVVGHMDGGVMQVEDNPVFHVRGATKIYRRECWDALGGLIKAPGWDTVDELKANMLGWQTRSFSNFKLLQRRPTGATNSTWGNWVKNGRANYITGYHPLFMFAKCAGRVLKKPYVISAAGLMYGFLSCYFIRTPRVPDPALIRYVRRQQLRRLLLLESVWR
jgi:glycosyltransferase involved in cell wall biosynthesis